MPYVTLLFLWLLVGVFSPSMVAQVVQDGADVPTLTPLKSILPRPQTRVIALVADVVGDARYLTEKVNFTLDKGSLLPPGGEFHVPEGGRIIFRPMPGITSVLQEKTVLQLKLLDAVKSKGKIIERTCDLSLKEGSVYSALNKFNKQATRYRVQTPQAVAGAKGTEFLVTYRNGKGKIVVFSGTVTVKLRGKNRPKGGVVELILFKGQAVDIIGEGRLAKFEEMRGISIEEAELRKEMNALVSQYQEVETDGTNPFFTTSEVTDKRDASPIEIPGVIPSQSPNESNTSTNATVSPTGP